MTALPSGRTGRQNPGHRGGIHPVSDLNRARGSDALAEPEPQTARLDHLRRPRGYQLLLATQGMADHSRRPADAARRGGQTQSQRRQAQTHAQRGRAVGLHRAHRGLRRSEQCNVVRIPWPGPKPQPSETHHVRANDVVLGLVVLPARSFACRGYKRFAAETVLSLCFLATMLQAESCRLVFTGLIIALLARKELRRRWNPATSILSNQWF